MKTILNFVNDISQKHAKSQGQIIFIWATQKTKFWYFLKLCQCDTQIHTFIILDSLNIYFPVNICIFVEYITGYMLISF
jgi:hypothetical protein